MWIDADKLIKFILSAQDEEGGGIADRPGDMVDVFHTHFGIAGMCLSSKRNPRMCQDKHYSIVVTWISRIERYRSGLLYACQVDQRERFAENMGGAAEADRLLMTIETFTRYYVHLPNCTIVVLVIKV